MTHAQDPPPEHFPDPLPDYFEELSDQGSSGYRRIDDAVPLQKSGDTAERELPDYVPPRDPIVPEPHS